MCAHPPWCRGARSLDIGPAVLGPPPHGQYNHYRVLVSDASTARRPSGRPAVPLFLSSSPLKVGGAIRHRSPSGSRVFLYDSGPCSPRSSIPRLSLVFLVVVTLPVSLILAVLRQRVFPITYCAFSVHYVYRLYSQYLFFRTFSLAKSGPRFHAPPGGLLTSPWSLSTFLNVWANSQRRLPIRMSDGKVATLQG